MSAIHESELYAWAFAEDAEDVVLVGPRIETATTNPDLI